MRYTQHKIIYRILPLDLSPEICRNAFDFLRQRFARGIRVSPVFRKSEIKLTYYYRNLFEYVFFFFFYKTRDEL